MVNILLPLENQATEDYDYTRLENVRQPGVGYGGKLIY